MRTVTFDTLRVTERRRAAGIAPAHAIAEAKALHDALSQALETNLAPKSDIAAIRADLVDVRHEIERLAARIDARFGLVEGRFHVMDGKFDKLAWMLGMPIVLNAANFARQFF